MNDSTRELTDCHVRVTPALARRIRKAAFTEQDGRDARSALMIAAGRDPDALSSVERLTKANVYLERQVTQLNDVLKSGGFKAWAARRILSV